MTYVTLSCDIPLPSFYTNGGTGFEAFFIDTSPKTCVLVVATVTKKEFITLSLKEFPLETNRWVSCQCPLLSPVPRAQFIIALFARSVSGSLHIFWSFLFVDKMSAYS